MKYVRLYIWLLFFCSSCSVHLPDDFGRRTMEENLILINQKDKYRLYLPAGGTYRVEQSPSPDSSVWISLRSGLNDDDFSFKSAGSRPCLRVISAVDSVIVSNRYIDFRGTNNFRDLGGIHTQEGKIVKWGKLYRSDNLSGLLEKDFDKFNQLRIANVIDLRTEKEINNKPDNIPGNVNYIHYEILADGEDRLSQMRKKVIRGEVTTEEAQAMMIMVYRAQVSQDIEAIRHLIQRILTSEKPLLYHCSAGKDRTGITTALVLSVLKVDRETIMNEYLMTNYYRKQKVKNQLKKAKLGKIIYPKIDLNTIKAFMFADEKYLNAAFEMIDSQYGGIDNYIENALMIGKEQRKAYIEKFTY